MVVISTTEVLNDAMTNIILRIRHCRCRSSDTPRPVTMKKGIGVRLFAFRSCAQHGLNLGGESPLQALQWELLAETKGVHREVESERRSRQNLGPTNRKRI